MKRRPSVSRLQKGFSFIEILVVMGIITVLVSMVVVVVPMIQERAKRTKSVDNVSIMVKFYIGEGVGLSRPWPGYNGKNFILWLVASGQIDRSNRQNLEVLFSPGDTNYTLEKVDVKLYDSVKMDALKTDAHQDFLQLTSYAGRRNRDKGHQLDSKEIERGALIICDDDDGALHHSKGIVMGFTNGAARFYNWSDLEIDPPESKTPEGLLGDNAPTSTLGDDLKHMSSQN